MQSIKYLVADGVKEYIEEKGLFKQWNLHRYIEIYIGT